MNTFLYVLLAGLLCFLSPTNCSQDVSPIRLKLVQRNGKAAEVDAVVVQGSKRANNSSVADSDAVDSYFEMNPYSRENRGEWLGYAGQRR